MGAKLSAGLLMYRINQGTLEVLIAHMGGPYWARKDAGAWSIPKGEYDEGEDPRLAALREFAEEMGSAPPPGELVELGAVVQPSGKVITAYALRGDFDATTVVSNEFEMEWPRGSGVMRSFPEVDRADWFDAATARGKLVKGQVPFIERLALVLWERGESFSETRRSATW
ncbi:MAG: NUDIX domain-containing protein [Micromonosporaceae bacterium]|nr:NUDIX domain-containing protein [Micromonosporaceae bacterium]